MQTHTMKTHTNYPDFLQSSDALNFLSLMAAPRWLNPLPRSPYEVGALAKEHEEHWRNKERPTP